MCRATLDVKLPSLGPAVVPLGCFLRLGLLSFMLPVSFSITEIGLVYGHFASVYSYNPLSVFGAGRTLQRFSESQGETQDPRQSRQAVLASCSLLE